MKNKYLVFAIILLFYKQAMSQSWQWAKQENAKGESQGGCVDQFGNLFHVGYVTGSNNVIGTTTLTSSPTSSTYPFTSFICKYDPNGNMLWVRSYPASTGLTSCSDNSGNVYFTGAFAGTMVVGSTTLVGIGVSDIFIIKYDINGNILWAKAIIGSAQDGPIGMCPDASGNVLLIASCTGTNINFSGTQVTSTNSAVNVLCKYDVTGNYLWSTLNYSLESRAIDVNLSGEIILAGTFGSTAVVNTTTLQSWGINEMFLAKYSSTGVPIWALSAGSSSAEVVYAVKCDPAGDIYVCGAFQGGTFTLNTTTSFTNMSTINGVDAFFAKYSNSGSILWAKQVGGPQAEYGYSMAPYANGVYLAGGFSASTLTIGTTTYSSPNSGGADNSFFIFCDLAGNFQNISFLNFGGDDILNIYTDKSGSSCNLYLTADTYVSPSYIGTYTLTHPAGEYIISAKYSIAVPPIISISTNTLHCSNLTSTLTASGAASYTWMNGSTSSLITVPAGQSGIYVVVGVGTGSLTCASTATYNLLLDPVPVVTINIVPKTICVGQSATLSAIGANNYSWSTGQQTNTLAVAPGTGSVYAVLATHSVNACAETYSVQVTTNKCAGIDEERADHNINIYPVPATNYLKVEAPLIARSIVVKDLQDRTVLSLKPSNLNFELDLHELKGGVYLLFIDLECGLRVVKFLKAE